jgi:hypothetical protein
MLPGRKISRGREERVKYERKRNEGQDEKSKLNLLSNTADPCNFLKTNFNQSNSWHPVIFLT